MSNVAGKKGDPVKVDLSPSTLQANWSENGLTIPATVYAYGPDGKCTVTFTPPHRGVEGPIPMLDARLGRM